MKQIVLVVDFKGQYSRVIARRIRELNVYCEVVNANEAYKIASNIKPYGIILSGGPDSVFEDGALSLDEKIFKLKIPILGICYGAQVIAQKLGGNVLHADNGEYGKTKTEFNLSSLLFKGTKKTSITLMSHSDKIVNLPQGFKVVASSALTKIAAFENADENIYATQFHPEVLDTECGEKIFENFLFNICGCKKNWELGDFISNTISSIKEKVKDKRVLLALSGGVDSCVLAAILNRAIGRQLVCVFVDHGFLRKGESHEIKEYFKNWDMNFVPVDASSTFLNNIKGITDPEEKRKVVGRTFIEVFEKEAKNMGEFYFLAQGTIYPDIIESGINCGKNGVIKSHHNVGGLPEKINFKEILEPFKYLFKDEVRKVGKLLNLPDFIVYRQPFPGPGLCIRIVGEVTAKKLDILRDADYIFRQEVGKLSKKPSQYFAVLLGVKSVGVMGDVRSYCYSLALRAVETIDFMTADVFYIPKSVLDIVCKRIINEVSGINRVLYDITSKPPATIEYE